MIVSLSHHHLSLLSSLSSLIIYIIGVSITQLVGGFLSQYCFGVITERLASRVRTKSFQKMLHMDVQWFDQATITPGALSQSLATDAINIKALSGERTATSISQSFTLLISLAVAFYMSWQMTLVMLAMLPVIGASFAIQASFVQNASGAAVEATNQAGNIASQALLNIRTVFSFNLEMQTLDKFSALLNEPRKQSIRKGAVTGAGMGFAQFVILSTAGLQWYIGLKLIQAGQLTFNQLLAVILTIMFGAVGLGQFAADASNKAEAIDAAKSITKLWNTSSTIPNDDDTGLKPEDIITEIRFIDANFAYPSRPEHQIYKGLNLTIEAGATVALVGPSGMYLLACPLHWMTWY